jgi:hypothetical protein
MLVTIPIKSAIADVLGIIAYGCGRERNHV